MSSEPASDSVAAPSVEPSRSRLLLLTDLHYGSDHVFRQGGTLPNASSSVGELVAAALSNELGTSSVDAIVLGGDFFSKDQPLDVALASAGVEDIMSTIPHSVVVATPGNHDLVWDASATGDPFSFYGLLVKASGLADFGIAGLPRLVQVPRGALAPIELLVLDSCRLESSEMRGIGYFGVDQLAAIDEIMETAGEGPRLAVFHHHLLPVWPKGQLPEGHNPRKGPPPPLSHTVDGIELIAKLREQRFVAAMHGHQHFPALVSYANALLPGAPLTIIGAGSAGAKGSQQHFFVVDIEETELVARSFATNPLNPPHFAIDAARPAVSFLLT